MFILPAGTFSHIPLLNGLVVWIHTKSYFPHKFNMNSSTEWEALWGLWRPASAQQSEWVEFKLMQSPNTSGVSTVQSFQTIQIMVGLFNIGLGSGRTSTYPEDVSSLGAAYWLGAVVNVYHNKPDEQIQLRHVLTVHCEGNHVYLGWTVLFKLSGRWLHQPTGSWIGNTLQYDSYFLSVFPLRWASLCSWMWLGPSLPSSWSCCIL